MREKARERGVVGSFEKDASLQVQAGDWCRCACVNTRVNAKMPARRGGEKEDGKRDRFLAVLQSWADLSSHIVTHHLSTIQFRFQSSYEKTQRKR